MRRLRIYGDLRRLPRTPYVDHGDWLDEDQWCLYTPKGGEKIKVAFNVAGRIRCAVGRRASITIEPYSLLPARHGEERRGEARAGERHRDSSPIELMEELRKKRFGNEAPVFKF